MGKKTQRTQQWSATESGGSVAASSKKSTAPTSRGSKMCTPPGRRPRTPPSLRTQQANWQSTSVPDRGTCLRLYRRPYQPLRRPWSTSRLFWSASAPRFSSSGQSVEQAIFCSASLVNAMVWSIFYLMHQNAHNQPLSWHFDLPIELNWIKLVEIFTKTFHLCISRSVCTCCYQSQVYVCWITRNMGLETDHIGRWKRDGYSPDIRT